MPLYESVVIARQDIATTQVDTLADELTAILGEGGGKVTRYAGAYQAYAEAKRARTRLRAARQEIAVGKIAGAVGTYAHLSPEIEREALASLGLTPEVVSTQVVARDRHAGDALQRLGEVQIRELADVFGDDGIDLADRITLDIDRLLQALAEADHVDAVELYGVLRFRVGLIRGRSGG